MQPHAVRLQDLDECMFSTARYDVASIHAQERKATDLLKVALILYGDIRLSPYQALDVALLRKEPLASLIADKRGSPISFVGPAPSKSRPFTNYLLRWLRRSGDDAFVFSSLPDGIALAKVWSATVDVSLSDSELLLMAERFSEGYGQIVAHARVLDDAAVRVHESRTPQRGLDSLLDEADGLVQGLSRPARGWPATMSAAEQRTAETATSRESF